MELLIVIVVIAILAAITIVTYNGIQTKAKNSQTLAGVEAYRKAIELYYVDNGFYPQENGCLGANYPSDTCWTGSNGNYGVDGSLDNKLAKYIPTKPVVSTKILQITSSPDYRLGALYRTHSSTDHRIIYYLEGPGQTCLSGGTGYNEMQGTQCSIFLN